MHTAVGLVVAVFDVILKCGAIALNVDVEHFLNGVAIIEERASRNGVPVAERGIAPQSVEFFKGDVSVTLDSIDNPHIYCNLISCHN